MILAYVLFYVMLAILMLALTEYRKEVRIFAQKYFKKDDPEKISVNAHYHEILTKYFRYYIPLSHDSKIKFASRVSEFVKHKTFVGMEGLKVTDEMKVLISASAIQLTFGLEKYLMEFFTTIRIYPRYFYSKLLQAELKGGASESGVLMLSWEDFLLGYRHPHDNYNLGLHEMAHVLKINVIKGKDFDEKFSFYLDDWLKIGDREFQRLKRRDKSLLREYGGSNHHEFFAVCVEHFFESPDQFKENLPDIFNHLCFLLNQDPRNVEDDYKLREDFARVINKNKNRIPIPKRLKEHYKYHGWHWTYTVMLMGIFIGIVTTMLLNTLTIIPVLHLIIFTLLGGGLAFLFQFRFLVQKNQVFKTADFFLYTVFGVMPLVSALFLLLNFSIRTSHFQEVYYIEDFNRRNGEVIVQLKGNAYENYPSVRTVSTRNFDFVSNHRLLKIKFSRGVFGYHFLIGNEIITPPKE